MKNFFLLCVSISFLCESCDPPRDCIDPSCTNSSITFKFKGNINDTNRVLHIGDTLKMYLKVPDTLLTSIGQYYLGSVQYADIAIDYNRIDTIINKSTWKSVSKKFLIKKGKFAFQSSAVEFDYPSKEIELYFIAEEKGNFHIQFSPQPSRLEITDKSGKKLLLMMSTSLNVKNNHLDMYLSLIGDISYKDEARIYINDLAFKGVGTYTFKVE